MPTLEFDPAAPSSGRYKLSQYNIKLAPNQVFNSVTGAFIELTSQQLAEYEHVEQYHDIADSEVAENLYSWGFIVESEIRELKALEAVWHTSITSRKTPLLTIAPTMNCNFGCDYCFETHEKGHMSSEVRAGLIDLIRKQLAANGPTALNVTWFGGEPLMGLPVILDLADRFDRLVDQGVLTKWDATLITNGLLATPKTMSQLRNLSSIQVTIDGPREIHDQRRLLKHGGKPTFDRICANLADLPEGLTTLIRVNVDRRNAEELERCAEQLDEAGVLARPEASIYLGIVESYEPPAMARTNRLPVFTNLLTTKEFAEIQQRFLIFCRERGYSASGDRPAPSLHGVCQVDNVSAYVVDPNGTLMKCWAELRNSPDVVASVLDPATWPDPKLSFLEQRDPFDDADCCKCKLLPVCMGGCPKIRAINRASGKKVCPPFKYNFDFVLSQALPDSRPGSPVYVTTPKLLRIVK